MTAPTEEEAWGLEAQPPYLPLEALERRDALWARGTMLVYEPETAQGASLPSPGLGRLLCVPSPLTIPFSTHPAVLTTHAAARATRTVLHTVLGGAVVVDCAAGSFCLCAVTPAALYALRRPAPAYAAHCVTLARRCGLLARCAAALASPEGGRLSYVDVVSRATALPLPPSTLLPSDSRRALTELDLVACAPALVAQLRQLGEAGCVPAQALDASPFMAHLRALAQPLPGAPPQQPGSYMAAYGPDGPPPAQQAAPADGSSPKAKKAPKQPRGDKAAPPPVVPRTSPFPALPGLWECLPREVMPDLLMLWDLLGTFAGLLRLPPVPLSRAAHAFYGPVDGNPLAPGDTTAARCVFADACRAMVHILDGDAQPPGGAAAGSSEPGGAPRVSRAMRLLGTDARAGASPALLCAAIDRAAWPARALAWHTRAVHSASHAPQAGGEPGGEGDVSSGEGDDDTDGAAHAHSVAAGARLSSRAALRALRTAAESDGDPWDALEPQQRCALAIGLADALSASEAFRAHYDALTDAATAERTAGRAPPYPVPGGSGEGPSWEEAAVHRAMLRRGQPVGWDADGRRYLELAGACGANCLVVAAPLQGGAEHQEETPQLSWHLVEPGPSAAALLPWLDGGQCAGERTVASYVARLAQAPGSGDEQKRFWPAQPVGDGYAAVAEPFLGASSSVGGLHAVRHVCSFLARRCRFWNLKSEQVAQLAGGLRSLDEEGPPPGLLSVDAAAKQVDDTATLLAASGALGPAWVGETGEAPPLSLWRARLAESLSPGQLAARCGELTVALDAASDGSASAPASPMMRRNAFVRAAQHHDPSLYVPAVGDTVAVARGGLASTVEAGVPHCQWGVDPAWVASCPPVMTCAVVAMAYCAPRQPATPQDGPPGKQPGRRRGPASQTAPPVPPVAWCLLDGGAHVGCFAAPLVLSHDSQEYVQRAPLVAAALARPWAAGQSVACLISDDDPQEREEGGDGGPAAVPHMYYEVGTVQQVRGQPGMPGWDPWEGVCVLFAADGGGDGGEGEGTRVWCSPWELVPADSLATGDAPPAGGVINVLDDSGGEEEEALPWGWAPGSHTRDMEVGPPKTQQQHPGASAAQGGQRRQQGASQRGGRAALRGVRRAVSSPHTASPAAVAAAAKAVLARFQASPDGASDAFMAAYTAFWSTRGGVPRTPVFARKELELWTSFLAVASRGGYDAVTASKQWIVVARALPGRDLSTATSASFAVRIAYERSCLAFEHSAVAHHLQAADPFPPGCDPLQLIAAGLAAPAPQRRARAPAGAASDGSEEEDDDEEEEEAPRPVKRAAPRGGARGAPPRRSKATASSGRDEATRDFDLARVAAGRRAVPRVTYADLSEGEADPDDEYEASDGGGGDDDGLVDDDEEEEEDDDDDDFKAVRRPSRAAVARVSAKRRRQDASESEGDDDDDDDSPPQRRPAKARTAARPHRRVVDSDDD